MRYIFTAEDISTQTANTASSDIVFTNSAQTPITLRLRSAIYDPIAGGQTTSMWVIVRRVPSGYTAPTTITVASGSSTFINSADVLGYSFQHLGAGGAGESIDFRMVRPTVTLFPGDAIVLQGVVSTTSTNAGFSAALEYDTAVL